MRLKLKKRFTIGQLAVEHSGTVGDYEYYTDLASETIHIVKGDEVVGEIDIDCDMGQGIGYVSEVTAKEYR